jgi:hypothetical protein
MKERPPTTPAWRLWKAVLSNRNRNRCQCLAYVIASHKSQQNTQKPGALNKLGVDMQWDGWTVICILLAPTYSSNRQKPVLACFFLSSVSSSVYGTWTSWVFSSCRVSEQCPPLNCRYFDIGIILIYTFFTCAYIYPYLRFTRLDLPISYYPPYSFLAYHFYYSASCCK